MNCKPQNIEYQTAELWRVESLRSISFIKWTEYITSIHLRRNVQNSIFDIKPAVDELMANPGYSGFKDLLASKDSEHRGLIDMYFDSMMSDSDDADFIALEGDSTP